MPKFTQPKHQQRKPGRDLPVTVTLRFVYKKENKYLHRADCNPEQVVSTVNTRICRILFGRQRGERNLLYLNNLIKPTRCRATGSWWPLRRYHKAHYCVKLALSKCLSIVEMNAVFYLFWLFKVVVTQELDTMRKIVYILYRCTPTYDIFTITLGLVDIFTFSQVLLEFCNSTWRESTLYRRLSTVTARTPSPERLILFIG